jgi:hypothetical protein
MSLEKHMMLDLFFAKRRGHGERAGLAPTLVIPTWCSTSTREPLGGVHVIASLTDGLLWGPCACQNCKPARVPDTKLMAGSKTIRRVCDAGCVCARAYVRVGTQLRLGSKLDPRRASGGVSAHARVLGLEAATGLCSRADGLALVSAPSCMASNQARVAWFHVG